MPLRLIVHLPQRVLKIPLEKRETLIGSHGEVDALVSHPTVSRRHAVLRRSDQGITLEDLGSSNGTLVDGRRIREAVEVRAGYRLAFGSVTAELEEVREGDLRPALSIGSPALETEAPPLEPKVASSGRATVSSSALEEFTLRQLPGLLEELRAKATPVEVAQAVGAAVFSAFPCLEVRISRRRGDGRAIWFEARAAQSPPESPEAQVRTEGEIEVRVIFFPATLGKVYGPVVDAMLHLVALGQRTAPPPRRKAALEPPPLPAPASVDRRVRDLYHRGAQIAPGNIGVLIGGESGTGKEVLARYLHRASGRPLESFIALNCAALPRDLLELELFGIEQAVATGVDARAGKFELAEGGTLFLDEIGDMALETQAKILRVLQEGEVYRLGGKQPRGARPRILAATNRDIDAMVKSGAFRSDLYHRIAGWVVRLPPLRERRGDIPNLAAYFLNREAQRRGVRIAGVSRSALEALLAWDWPGNVRELEREIARAALFLGDGELLESSLLGGALRGCLDQPGTSLKDMLERKERSEIEKALALAGGDTAAAAERLGVGRSTLYRRMKTLGVQE
ncbi:MAG: sigma 54-interacting transcriptional regulator [Deltaproteobacteria bacterium]|nr:sigma 54-interacting transcriptional regulator [Deltaproteobacteria bacterium]